MNLGWIIIDWRLFSFKFVLRQLVCNFPIFEDPKSQPVILELRWLYTLSPAFTCSILLFALSKSRSLPPRCSFPFPSILGVAVLDKWKVSLGSYLVLVFFVWLSFIETQLGPAVMLNKRFGTCRPFNSWQLFGILDWLSTASRIL